MDFSSLSPPRKLADTLRDDHPSSTDRGRGRALKDTRLTAEAGEEALAGTDCRRRSMVSSVGGAPARREKRSVLGAGAAVHFALVPRLGEASVLWYAGTTAGKWGDGCFEQRFQVQGPVDESVVEKKPAVEREQARVRAAFATVETVDSTKKAPGDGETADTVPLLPTRGVGAGVVRLLPHGVVVGGFARDGSLERLVETSAVAPQ